MQRLTVADGAAEVADMSNESKTTATYDPRFGTVVSAADEHDIKIVLAIAAARQQIGHALPVRDF